MPRRGLSLDTRILALQRNRLLLGAGHLGPASSAGPVVDARLLGRSRGFLPLHDGYWGRHVGFYGGVNYGHGYAGSGYEGGRWDNGHFAYNTAVNNVNTTTIHNTYVKNVTVVNVTTVTNVSYVGGSGGTVAQPSNAELAYAREAHRPPTADQARHVQAAASDPAFRAAENHGRPAVAATARPSEFRGPGVVAAQAAPERRGPDQHPADAQHPNRGPAAQGGPRQDHAAPQASTRPAQDDKAAPNARRPVQPVSDQPTSHPKPPAAQQKQKPEDKKAKQHEDKKAKQHEEHEPQKN